MARSASQHSTSGEVPIMKRLHLGSSNYTSAAFSEECSESFRSRHLHTLIYCIGILDRPGETPPHWHEIRQKLFTELSLVLDEVVDHHRSQIGHLVFARDVVLNGRLTGRANAQLALGLLASQPHHPIQISTGNGSVSWSVVECMLTKAEEVAQHGGPCLVTAKAVGDRFKQLMRTLHDYIARFAASAGQGPERKRYSKYWDQLATDQSLGKAFGHFLCAWEDFAEAHLSYTAKSRLETVAAVG